VRKRQRQRVLWPAIVNEDSTHFAMWLHYMIHENLVGSWFLSVVNGIAGTLNLRVTLSYTNSNVLLAASKKTTKDSDECVCIYLHEI